MSETLTHSAQQEYPADDEAQASLFDIEDLKTTQPQMPEVDFEAPLTQEANEEARELSPTSSSIMRAATRVSKFLERRAVNKAHKAALKEYRDIDHADYVDYLANLSQSSEASPTAQASAQLALDREHRKAVLEAIADRTKATIKRAGQSALSRYNSTRATVTELTVGAGIRTAAALEPVKEKVNVLADKTGEGIMTGFQKLENGMDRVGENLNNKADSFKETISDIQAARAQKTERSEESLRTEIYKKHAEKVTRINERRQRKQAAIERRAERRARWSAIVKESISSNAMVLKAGYNGTLDKVSEMSERAKREARLTREAGRLALEARDNKA